MTTRDSELDDALAEARPAEQPGLALARARVAGALFGRPAAFGRFHVLDRIGHGGMGVVYAAYDPELDRGVALKMVGVAQGDRARALVEAKALARLSHPHVVPIFDVGIVDDRVYLVMELVRGETLRDWVKGKRAADIIAIYRQAGQALAAAHDAGLVHRDFKPENAIVGTDGRVRVVDFGLACEARAADQPRAGTPGYMAPEAGEVTPAADQYSFCVSLAEALGDAPPAWVNAIIERGRAPDPARRFPAMAELLRALGRDPARVWRWRLVGVGVASVAVAAFLVGRGRGDEPAIELCSTGASEIARSWADRDAQLARIATLSTYGRELAPRIASQLEQHTNRWGANHRDACTMHLRRLQSDAMFDRRTICLERGRAAVAAIGRLAASADANALPGLAKAVASLPDPDACADLAALASDVSPPPPAIAPRVAALRSELETARVQLAAGQARTAQATAHAAATELRGLDYPPLLAEALLVEGQAAMTTDDAHAIRLLREATALAIGSRLDTVAVEAWARRAWIEGDADPAGALAGLDVIALVARRTSGATFARALLYNNVGSIELGRDRKPQAREAFRVALALARDVRGAHAVELSAIRRNMAHVIDDDGEREQLLRGARDELVQLLGAGHPDAVASEFVHAARGIVEMRAAASALAAVCDRLAAQERLAAQMPTCLGELADLHHELGDRERARTSYERAIAHGGETLEEFPEATGYVRLLGGDPAGAARAFDAALAKLPLAADSSFRDRYVHAKLRLGQGRALRAAGKPREARDALEQGLALFDALAERTLFVRRRHNATRAELAQLGAPRDVAAAIEWYRATGVEGRRAELERLRDSARP